jgi:hypothetical protein
LNNFTGRFRSWFWLIAVASSLSSPVYAQNEQEPEPTDPPKLELPLNPEQMMQEVSDAIEVVRQSFADLDRLLLETRTMAESPDTDSSSQLGERLGATADQAEQLMADIEELLTLLPESDDSSSSSSGSSSSNDSGKPNPGQDRNNPKDGPKNPGRNQAAPEGDTGKSEMPFMSPLLIDPNLGGGAWGYLPPRLQETLQNAHAEDLPLRYRGLLEEFHLRNMSSSKRR